jgi:hypothetical protein
VSKFSDDKKEQYSTKTRENDSGERQKGDADASTGGLSSQRSEYRAVMSAEEFAGSNPRQKNSPSQSQG